jgi:hypothetical protein
MADYGANFPYGDSYYKDEGQSTNIVAAAPPYPSLLGGDLVSFSIAILPTQGVGPSENSGEAFVTPFEGCPGFHTIDDNSNERHLVIDCRDRKLYDVATKTGPGNSGLVKRWRDKVESDGTSGTAIIPRVRFFDDLGTFENFLLRNAVNHIFGRCTDPADRGSTGFDAEGFITGTQWTLRLFADGERLVAERTASAIPLVSDVHFDGHEEAHRFAIELEASQSGHIITGRKMEYIVIDKATGSGVSTENDLVETLSTPSRWYSRTPTGFLDNGNGTFVDRITGEILDEVNAGSSMLTNGPNDLGSALWCNDRVAIPGQAGSMLFLGQYVAAVLADSTPLTLTEIATIDGFTLYYVADIPTCTTIYIDHAGTPGVWTETFDIRVFPANLSADARAFYLDNIQNNDGDVVLP